MLIAKKITAERFLKAVFILWINIFGSILCAENIKSQCEGYVVVPQLQFLTKNNYTINNKISPCVDFYAHACSPVIDGFKLQGESLNKYSSRDYIKRQLLEYKKEYFLNLAQKKPESEIEKEVRDYYLGCMNQKARKEEARKFIAQTKAMLKKITTKEEFSDMIVEDITVASTFIRFNAYYPNLKNPNKNDLYFDTGLISLHKSYYEREEVVGKLKSSIEEFFIVLEDEASKEKAALVFNFSRDLARKYPDKTEIENHLYNPSEVSREFLTENYPYLKLGKFLAKIPQHVTIRNIIGDDVMGFLNEKLKTAPLEELKSVFIYFRLRTIVSDAYSEFDNIQERCADNVMGIFNMEVDSVLLPKIFPGFSKEKFVELVEKVRASLLEQLSNNLWLSEDAKQEAIRKIKNIRLSVVSPASEEEWDFLPMTIYSTDTPIANIDKLRKLVTEKRLKDLSGYISTNRWEVIGVGPLTPKAHYNKSYNKILIPIAMLQYPFYDPNESDEVNLGGIGTIIGHELNHAIDSYGNTFNADGVFKPWMSDEDLKFFEEKTSHLVGQFNKIGHKGEFTLVENVADLVGLITAYKAAFPDNKGSQELKQKFFLQFARVWCSIRGEEVLENDSHASEYAMVNEQLKHQIGFREAYDCELNDPMVIPEDEIVKVW